MEMRGLEPLASYMRINFRTRMKSRFSRKHGRSTVAECVRMLQRVAGVMEQLPYNCRTTELLVAKLGSRLEWPVRARVGLSTAGSCENDIGADPYSVKEQKKTQNE
jgi:hypothetical protein